MILLETERLVLRTFTHDDADFIVELLNTEGWIRFIGQRNVKTKDDAIKYLEEKFFPAYKSGFSAYGIELKESGELIGMSTLLKRDHLSHPDLGYALLPAYVGMGYAMEATTALADYAKNKLGLPAVMAIINHDNESSIRLVNKLGFIFDKVLMEEGKEIKVFRKSFS